MADRIQSDFPLYLSRSPLELERRETYVSGELKYQSWETHGTDGCGIWTVCIPPLHLRQQTEWLKDSASCEVNPSALLTIWLYQ